MPVRGDDLGTRMKEFYEKPYKTKLTRRTPVAIRIDGKAFHTFTRGFQKPFDPILMKAMQHTMKYLCENIQDCVFGFTQSDEITLILIDYQKLDSSAWFDYEVQKMCSISSSMATMAFNKYFSEMVMQLESDVAQEYETDGDTEWVIKMEKYLKAYRKSCEKGAMFASRCFNIPKEEVCNLVYWRQLDATRNSIQMVGQANFSHNELQGKSCNMIQDMLLTQKNINWNNYPVACKRGSACIKVHGLNMAELKERPHWCIDENMPILKDEHRRYVDDFIFVGEE